MDLKFSLEFLIFTILVVLTILIEGFRIFKDKGSENWFIDLFSLFMQGTAVPIIQSYFVLLFFLKPYEGTLELPGWLAFLINFVFLDFIYFHIHRGLHKKGFWGFHLLHHSAQKMDVITTSRNSFWTTFLMPYIWVNGLMLVLLNDKSWYIFAISLTAMLDLWRHSPIYPDPSTKAYKLLSLILITPLDHAWHHSSGKNNINFGANLNIWDRLYKSYYAPLIKPSRLGFQIKSSLMTKLFFPLKLERENS
ncbi:MAG: sterol desaturase [Halobacteriovoraceae bacterium]|nr:sterol desaturase [Halobacteriovoraceae bacterium]